MTSAALDAIDRELGWLRERAAGPRPPMLGCSRVAHDRLGYCAACVPPPRDDGPHIELNGWRLLALRDDENVP